MIRCRVNRLIAMEEKMSLDWIHARRSIRKYIDAAVGEADVIPFAFVPIGHPAEFKSPARRCNPERVHSDRW